jgi:FMN-dependent oxidoreductase (nitrilotriacetate monooxygenase family)
MSRFHLGWFLGPGFGVQGWNQPGFGRNYPIWKPDLYVDSLRTLERGMFDMLIIEDSSMVPNVYGGSSSFYLKHGIMAPKHDPVPLVPLLSQATTKIGIVPTLTTTFYPPFLLARLMTTLDHITDGRIGWNIVTSTSHLSAQNYGMDQLPEHDKRYDMADEFVELVGRLWDSWEPGAFVMDEATDTLVDGSKVHTIDFEGKYYKSRGPLNAPRSPQGRPVFVQAGGSPRGKRFAAGTANAVISGADGGIEKMKAFRDDIRLMAAEAGRDPADVKILFMSSPVLGETDQEAREKRGRQQTFAEAHPELGLLHLSRHSGIDFAQWDIDERIPMDATTNGHQQMIIQARGKTPREILRQGQGSLEFAGSPDTVAAQMDEAMQEIGGDGFLIADFDLNRRYISEIADGLAPALKRRGLTRTEYGYDHFRDNLLEF